MGDLEAVSFAGINGAAQRLEAFHEKRADKVGLEAASFGLFHFFLYRKETLRAETFLSERVAFEEVFDVGAVEGGVDALEAFGVALGLVVVADGIQQEILEASFLKHFTKDVEDATFEGFVDRFQLGEQAVIHLALAGFLGDEIP